MIAKRASCFSLRPFMILTGSIELGEPAAQGTWFHRGPSSRASVLQRPAQGRNDAGMCWNPSILVLVPKGQRSTRMRSRQQAATSIAGSNCSSVAFLRCLLLRLPTDQFRLMFGDRSCSTSVYGQRMSHGIRISLPKVGEEYVRLAMPRAPCALHRAACHGHA